MRDSSAIPRPQTRIQRSPCWILVSYVWDMTTKLLLRVAFLELPRNFLSPKRRLIDTPKGPGLVSEEGRMLCRGISVIFRWSGSEWQRRPAPWPATKGTARKHVREGDEPLLTFVPKYQLHTPETLNNVSRLTLRSSG